jgi:hypothetical protein
MAVQLGLQYKWQDRSAVSAGVWFVLDNINTFGRQGAVRCTVWLLTLTSRSRHSLEVRPYI